METETMFGQWIILDGVYGVSVYPEDYFSEVGPFTSEQAAADYIHETYGED